MTEPLPAANARSPAGVKVRPRQLRILAGFLAVLSLVMAADGTRHMIEDRTWFSGPWRTSLLEYGSTYLAAGALCWRALQRPRSRRVRRGIWGFAALLFGICLGVYLNGLLRSSWSVAFILGILFGTVYAGMTFFAVMGFVFEPADARGSD